MRKFVLLFLLFLFIPLPAWAEEKFETKYEVNYQVESSGITQVTNNITLKNKTDEFRASEYALEIGLGGLTEIQVTDAAGPITPQIEEEKNKTKIKFTFNQAVVGRGKILPFQISFKTQELAKKKGLIWEVNIPGIEKEMKADDYRLTLSVPASFGPAAFIKPAKNMEGGKLTWSREEIPRGGILLSFGEFQVYKFNLKYHLKNPRLYPVQTEIALPPQTNYQKIFLNEINPAPLNVKLDPDGNWLASFALSPSSSLIVEVKGTAQVFLVPQTQEELNPTLRKTYLSSQKYWETTDPEIQKLAATLKTPNDIYNFLVRELTYDAKKVEGNPQRLGAAGILKNKTSAICMEFTDLFIALARAAGIPAREINGFAYTQDENFRPLSLFSDVLHAWPEFYDEERKTWISVDPTWGNTTGGLDYFQVLDFDHLAFVVKGVDSRYPVPAGGYKTNEHKDSKDVQISFGQKEDLIARPEVEFSLKIPPRVPSFLPIAAQLVFENRGNTLLPRQTLTVSSDKLLPSTRKIEIPSLPPNGKQETTISFAKTSLLTNEKAIIRLNDENQSREFSILVSPLAIFERRDFIFGGGLISVIFIFFFARAARRLYLSRRKPPDSLYRQSQKPEISGPKPL